MLYHEYSWQYFSWLHRIAILEYQNRIIGSVFIIPIIYGAISLRRFGASVASIFALAAVIPILSSLRARPEFWLWNIIILLLPLLILYLIVIELEWRTRIKLSYKEREKEHEFYINKIVDAQENERRYFAGELHDETIQTLVAIANQVETLSLKNSVCINEAKLLNSSITKMFSNSHRELNGEKTQSAAISEQLEKISGTLQKNNNEVSLIKETIFRLILDLRGIIQKLRPVTLDKLGILPALRWLVDCMNKETSINTSLSIIGNEHKLTPQMEINIFRIVQEGLANIKRHSKADKATITVSFFDEYMIVKIEDNGCGFKLPESVTTFAMQNKLGLIGIYERVKNMSGNCNIISENGNGIKLVLDIPYSKG